MRKLRNLLLIFFSLASGMVAGVVAYHMLSYVRSISVCGINYHYLSFQARGDGTPAIKESADMNLIVSPERLMIDGFIRTGDQTTRVNRVLNLSRPLQYPGGIGNVISVAKQDDDRAMDSGMMGFTPQKGEKMKFSFSGVYNNGYLLSINDYRLGVCTHLRY